MPGVHKKMEQTTKAGPVFRKFKYFNGFCVSSFSTFGYEKFVLTTINYFIFGQLFTKTNYGGVQLESERFNRGGNFPSGRGKGNCRRLRPQESESARF
jgi:hypothetical protein